jgi:hypothetical protein
MLAHPSANSYLQVLRNIFRFAARDGMLAHNPAAHLKYKLRNEGPGLPDAESALCGQTPKALNSAEYSVTNAVSCG